MLMSHDIGLFITNSNSDEFHTILFFSLIFSLTISIVTLDLDIKLFNLSNPHFEYKYIHA